MPIYAYACGSCGLRQDVMQKMSDVPLSICPECGKQTFTKQLTAAGFQLKGSGYYVTDFRGGVKPPEAKPEAQSEGKPESKPESKPDNKPTAPAAPAPSAPTASGAA